MRIWIDALKQSLHIYEDLFEMIPAELKHTPPGPGMWNIIQHFSHLALVQPHFAERIKDFINKENPKITPYPNGDDADVPGPHLADDKLLQVYRKERIEQLNLLTECTDHCWQKTAEHPEYKVYNLESLIRHIVLHDYLHFYRIEELRNRKTELINPLKL